MNIIEELVNIFIKPVINAFPTVFKPILDAIAKTDAEGIIKNLQAQVAVVKPAYLVGPPTSTPTKFTKMWDGLTSGSVVVHGLAGSILAGTVVAAAIPTTSIGDAIDEVWRMPFISALMTTTYDFHRSYYDDVTRHLMRRSRFSDYTPLLPEPYRLADMVAKELIDIPKYDEAMAESGLDKDWAAAWREIMYNYPTLETALRLLRRGDITEKDFNNWLIRQNMPIWVRDKVVKLREVIPPIQDLRLMAVREAFPVAPGLPQYKEMEKHALRQGLTPWWTERYYYAGFRRMDVDEAMRYFLWYNDLPKEYEDWLVIADIHPDDRPRVKTVSYTVPSIRELGYGWDMGLYSLEDIIGVRRRGGLNPVDAVRAGSSLVAFRLSAETEAVRREWLHLYALGKKTDAEFAQKLLDLNTPAEAIPLWLERGELEAERKRKPDTDIEYRIVTSGEAKWMFEHGLKDEAWLRAKLEDLDWNKERVDVAVVTIKQRLIEKEKPPVEVKYRNLTVTQIRDLWRLGKIPGADVPAFLEAIGYSPADAAGVAQIIMYVPPDEMLIKPYTDAWARRLYGTRLLDTEELFENYMALDYDAEHATKLTLSTLVAEKYPMLVAQYRKGWITDAKVLEELVDMGMEGEDAIALLEHTIQGFQLERIERERDLTKAEVVKGVKKAVIRPEEGVMLLQDLGYAEWEAMFILDINRVVAAGDPEGYWEMRRVVEAYKKARGEPYVTIPDEVLDLEHMIAEQKRKIEKMRAEEATAEQIAKETTVLGDLEKQLKTMLIAKKLT